eukprot:CAMPEP_0185740856 /NCGR_PEP_ID=MMETSP1171-20130828/38647_1 /TAXON_ID=374046 /ORGANISM="Helicotheca tamensis, Strain CCMP826" /LENGTH=227 /DNA_ID=CAMNT_0028412785 /DNA_START=113 /DNA_END=796 /DNA_ORIENTATION=+
MKLSYKLFTIASITSAAISTNAFVPNHLSQRKPCATTLAMGKGSLIPFSSSLMKPSKFFQDFDEYFEKQLEEFDEFFEVPMMMKMPKKLFSEGTDLFKDLELSRQRTSYNIEDADDKVILTVDTPGMKADDIDVKLEHDGRMIRLSGMKKSKEGGVEIESRFDKAFMLGKNVFDTDKITANLVDGVLTVTAPKKGEKGKNEGRIEVTEIAPEPVSETAVSEETSKIE